MIYGAGTWTFNYSTDGCINYSAGSVMGSLVVNKINSQTSLTFDKISPQNYGNSIIPTCSVISGQGSPVLQMNSLTINSGQTLTLGAGSYMFNCSYAGNQNYSASSQQVSYTINKNSPTSGMSISGTTPITYGAISNFAGSETNTGDADCV